MTLIAHIRRGEGPVYRRLKCLARTVLQAHVPVFGPTRLVFGLLYRTHVFVREGWIWFTRFFWHEPLFRSQCESIGPRFQLERLPYLTGSGKIIIGSGVRLSGKSTIGFSNRMCAPPRLCIGDDTFIGHDCRFAIAGSLSIGAHCLLAGGVTVRDFDGHPIDAEQRRAGKPNPPEEIRTVTIGDDVWIGEGACILKGVTIGDRSIVAARSVVTKSVPPDTIIAGNPARVIRNLAAAMS